MQKHHLIKDNISGGKIGKILSIIVVAISFFIFMDIYSMADDTTTIIRYYIILVISFLFLLSVAIYVVGNFTENGQKNITFWGCIGSWTFLAIFDVYKGYYGDFSYLWYLWLIAGSLEVVSICMGTKREPKKVLDIIAIILSSLTFFEMLGCNITGLVSLRDHITMFIVSILSNNARRPPPLRSRWRMNGVQFFCVFAINMV